jgi:hypothetical protein
MQEKRASFLINLQRIGRIDYTLYVPTRQSRFVSKIGGILSANPNILVHTAPRRASD